MVAFTVNPSSKTTIVTSQTHVASCLLLSLQVQSNLADLLRHLPAIDTPTTFISCFFRRELIWSLDASSLFQVSIGFSMADESLSYWQDYGEVLASQGSTAVFQLRARWYFWWGLVLQSVSISHSLVSAARGLLRWSFPWFKLRSVGSRGFRFYQSIWLQDSYLASQRKLICWGRPIYRLWLHWRSS